MAATSLQPGKCTQCYLSDQIIAVDDPSLAFMTDCYPWAIHAFCQRCRRHVFYCRFCPFQYCICDTGQLTRHSNQVDHRPLMHSLQVDGAASIVPNIDDQDTLPFEESFPEESVPSPPPGPTKLEFRKVTPAALHTLLRSDISLDPGEFHRYITHSLSPLSHTKVSPARMQRAEFLAAEHEDPGQGLIDLAIQVFSTPCASAALDMTLSWVLLAFLLSTIFLETGQYIQNSICFALQIVASKLSPEVHPPVLLPTHARQAQFYYVNQSTTQRGASSLLDVYNPNRAQSLTSGHAYFSLVTTIQTAHSLGNELEPSFLIDLTRSTVYQSSFTHSSTPRSLEILLGILKKLPVHTLPPILDTPDFRGAMLDGNPQLLYPHPIGVYNLIFWSDSFEANSTKQNRGSIWVLFCSIATPSSSGVHGTQNTFNSGKNTFLVAVGPSGRDVSHECVWSCLLQDLRLLNNTQQPLVTYSRFHRKELHSLFPVYVFLQDTPERTDSNGLASWKSNTNVIYGHTAPVVRVQAKLPSCQLCLQRRLMLPDVSQTPCRLCHDWSVPDLKPITYQSLLDLVKEAQAIHLSGGFPNRGSILAYLRTAGISPTVGKSIAGQLYSPPDTNTSLSTPSLWNYGEFVDVNDSIEVVMHLLFLGIVRSVAKDVVYPFLSARKQWTSYVERVKNLMQRITKLGLHWLLLQPIGISGSFGGWVSENYLGYCRISKYLGALTESLPCHDQPYQDPDVSWLVSRGLRVTKPALQTRARKIDYLATVEETGWRRPGDPPQTVANPKAGMPLSLFERVLVSCHTMVCSIMSVDDIPTDIVSNQILREIKLYLSYDHHFDSWSARSTPGTPNPWENPTTAANLDHPVLSMNLTRRGRRLHRDVSNLPPVSRYVSDDEQEDDGEELDDDAGSISDSSGEELPLDELVIDDLEVHEVSIPAVIHPNSYRIAAVRKRNKINLLKVPSTLQRFGTYHHLSELGPKGEGAIQTIKPVVKKLGGISKPNWAIHVARGWSSRKHSRNAISRVVDCLKIWKESTDNPLTPKDYEFLSCVGSALLNTASNQPHNETASHEGRSILDGDEELWGNLLDAVCTGKDLPKRRMHLSYKTKASALASFSDEIDPLSIVIVEPKEGEDGAEAWFALVYLDERKQSRLLRVQPQSLEAESCGCAFFRWQVVNSVDIAHPLLTSRVLKDYALLLPLDATLDGSRFVVYYLITYGWKEMVADGSIRLYSYRS